MLMNPHFAETPVRRPHSAPLCRSAPLPWSGLRAGSPVAARGLSGVSSGRAAAGRAQPIPVTGPAAPRRRRPFLPPSRPPARGVGGAGPARKNGAALNARGVLLEFTSHIYGDSEREGRVLPGPAQRPGRQVSAGPSCAIPTLP